MHLCRNMGAPGCHSSIAKIIDPQDDVRETTLWPTGRELERYDERCRKCKVRYFQIEDRKCFLCEDSILVPSALSQIKYVTGTEFLYQCPGCETRYFSYHELE